MNNPKSYAVIAAIVLLLPRLSAAEEKSTDYALSVRTDRAVPVYQTGEPVAFEVELTHKGEPVKDVVVKWRISKDGFEPPLQEGISESANFSLSGQLAEPGFLQCRVDVNIPGESVPTARAAAAIDPLNIPISLPPPEDFDGFWAKQKELLAETPANAVLTPVEARTAGVEVFDVQAASWKGAMSGYLAKPVGAKPKSLPAILLCHGAGVASSRQSIVEDWAQDGFLALDFNAHGLPNGKPREFYAALYKGELAKYYLSGVTSREATFFRELYLRMLRALDVLTAQPEWDGKILVAFGRSQGGAQAIAAAGLDPRVTFLAAQIPALCDHSGFTVSRINGWPKWIPFDAEGKPDAAAAEAARYYDGMNFAARTKADAFFTIGFIDVSCPPTGVYATYNQLTGNKDMLDQYHLGHRTSPEADAAARSAVLSHVATTKPKP